MNMKRTVVGAPVKANDGVDRGIRLDEGDELRQLCCISLKRDDLVRMELTLIRPVFLLREEKSPSGARRSVQ